MVTQPLVLKAPRYLRRFPATIDGDSLQPGNLWLEIGTESRLLLQALRETKGGEGGLRAVDDRVLSGWPLWPARLGDDGIGDGDVAAEIAGSPPLRRQLESLRMRHPRKGHFRVAVVNGFGTNLGDNLVGVTAFRHALRLMREVLPGVSVDTLHGVNVHPFVEQLLRVEPEFSQFITLAPSLLEFARYDAYLDFSTLLNRPRYDRMPRVDWYLWAMGLDPSAVDAAEKRNRLVLVPDDVRRVQALIEPLPRPRVLFAFKASLPLRSIARSSARHFAAALLSRVPELQLIVDQPLGLAHDRLVDLSVQVDSPGLHAALIQQCEGLIGVDSFGFHVADATATPAVVLLATLPPGIFPYYPLAVTMNPPGAEALSGWGCVKVGDADWKDMETDYAQAWDRLDPMEVWTVLQSRMRRREALRTLHPPQVSLDGPRRAPSWVAPTQSNAAPRLRYDVITPALGRAQRRLMAISRSMLRSGMAALQVGAGLPDLTLSMARSLGAEGTLHVVEPRQLRAQILAAHLVHEGSAASARVCILPFAPWQSGGPATLRELDPYSESDPSAWGNVASEVRVTARALDDLDVLDCHWLVLQPPMADEPVLRGAQDILRRCRPMLAMAPVNPDLGLVLAPLLAAARMRVWIEVLEPGESVLLLALPQEQRRVRLQGFQELEVSP